MSDLDMAKLAEVRIQRSIDFAKRKRAEWDAAMLDDDPRKSYLLLALDEEIAALGNLPRLARKLSYNELCDLFEAVDQIEDDRHMKVTLFGVNAVVVPMLDRRLVIPKGWPKLMQFIAVHEWLRRARRRP